MKHFVRFAMVCAMAAGASLYALAQEDDLLMLLDDSSAAETPVEEADLPAEEPAVAEEADLPAEEETLVEEIPAEEPAVEEVAEEPAAEEDALLDDLLAGDSEAPTEEPSIEEVVEETVAEDDTPVVEEETVVEEEPAVAETPADDNLLDDVSTVDEPTGDNLLEDISTESEGLVAEAAAGRQLNELAALERLRREGIQKYAEDNLKAARALIQTPPTSSDAALKQYDSAIEKYELAADYFGRTQRRSNTALRSECEAGVRQAKYLKAVELFKRKEYDAALKLAREVRNKGHKFGDQLIQQIETEMNAPVVIQPPVVLPEYAKEEYKLKRLEVQERFHRATVYFQLSKFKEANDQLELILRDDPGNEQAIDLRRRIERRDAEMKRQLKYSSHAEMIAQVEGSWTPLGALGRNSEELYRPTISKGSQTKVDDTGKREAAAVMEKLESIRLPEFVIRPPSTLADALSIFSQMSKDYDRADLPPEERGVDFILNIGDSGAAAAPAEEDEYGEPAAAGNIPTVDFISLSYPTIKDALDMVCEVTKMKYIIKGRTVMVVRPTYVDGVMETRTFSVMPGFIEKISGISQDVADAGASGGDDWGSSDSYSSGSASADLKSQMTLLGVPFEGAAQIVYLSSIGKLRVTNTPENLALFEGILEEFNATPSLIEVEARFVEVSQSDLNSLGFEWQLNSDIVGTVGSGIDWASSSIMNNANGGTAAGGTGANGSNVFRAETGSDANVAIHGGADALNNGMRFLGDESVYANRINLAGSTIAPDDTFASFSFVFGKLDMTMILHMLAQRTDTDMLSSPKVLASTGEEAIIKVVTEWIYPTEFDITELDEEDTWSSSSDNVPVAAQLNAPPVKFAVEPGSFEERDVGVTLQVTPMVSQEGQMIELLVAPEVVEYLGDFEYGMQVPYIQYGLTAGVITSAEVAYYQVSMPQPMFHSRKISTKLSVYNGATVAMGGLITETRKSFEDKVPFLGDLPFIGFLFRSTGEYSEKRNLLVFLTARLVDPAGRPLKTATDGRLGTGTTDSGASTMSSATSSN